MAPADAAVQKAPAVGSQAAAADGGAGEGSRGACIGPAAGCLAQENLDGCEPAQAVLVEVQRDFRALLQRRGDEREAAGKSREVVLAPESVKKDLDR